MRVHMLHPHFLWCSYRVKRILTSLNIFLLTTLLTDKSRRCQEGKNGRRAHPVLGVARPRPEFRGCALPCLGSPAVGPEQPSLQTFDARLCVATGRYSSLLKSYARVLGLFNQ